MDLLPSTAVIHLKISDVPDSNFDRTPDTGYHCWPDTGYKKPTWFCLNFGLISKPVLVGAIYHACQVDMLHVTKTHGYLISSRNLVRNNLSKHGLQSVTVTIIKGEF